MTESDARSIWDIPIDRLYPLALEFYRKEKSQIALDYSQRNKLLAYYKQVKLGPYTPEKEVEPGYFDVIGTDRRKAWKALGSMSQDEARRGLVALLDAATPKVREFALAQWRGDDSKAEDSRVEVKLEEMERKERETDKDGVDSGAVPDQQAPAPEHKDSVNGFSSVVPPPPPSTSPQLRHEPRSVLAPAALWCSPKAAGQFISQLQGTPDSQLVIDGGETVSIQVPTTIEASAIFWEFATTGSDVGFGLNFQRVGPGWPVEELLPVVRRDCSEDLLLGSHTYQTQGTYFLVFDNSLSPHTQKMIYYKVFYQRSA